MVFGCLVPCAWRLHGRVVVGWCGIAMQVGTGADYMQLRTKREEGEEPMPVSWYSWLMLGLGRPGLAGNQT